MAIKEAREKMGDYKLKTAKDYVVPERQRVNADKKKLQLLKLLNQVWFVIISDLESMSILIRIETVLIFILLNLDTSVQV